MYTDINMKDVTLCSHVHRHKRESRDIVQSCIQT